LLLFCCCCGFCAFYGDMKLLWAIIEPKYLIWMFIKYYWCWNCWKSMWKVFNKGTKKFSKLATKIGLRRVLFWLFMELSGIYKLLKWKIQLCCWISGLNGWLRNFYFRQKNRFGILRVELWWLARKILIKY
jgi:hypothetical protein